MSILNVNVDTVSVLKIGYTGENDAVRVIFDFSSWQQEYGAGALMLYVHRPIDLDPYPVTLSISGTKATWTVSDTDLSYPGKGHVQLIYSSGGTIKKSRIVRFIIRNSLGPASIDAPAAFQTWLDQITNIGLAAHADALDAAESAASILSQVQRMDDLENDIAELDTLVEGLPARIDRISLQLLDYVNNGYVEEGVAYFAHDDTVLFEITGIGGGGGSGGGSGNNAVLTVNNTTGWLSKTIASGADCYITCNWSSIEDEMPTGAGTMIVTVNSVVRHSQNIDQGDVSVNVSDFLSPGANTVKVRISDIYGNARTINFNITLIALSISSTFDPTIIYEGAIAFPYTPVGAAPKTVHFILDGSEIGTHDTSVSGRQITFNIPRQSHGGHTLRVYFDATVGSEIVRSNELYYEFISVVSGSSTVIITSSYGASSVQQYTSIILPYMVYDPAALTADVTISVSLDNEEFEVVSEQTVDRTQHTYTYRANDYGALKFKIASGNATKIVSIAVTELNIDVHAETENLALYLSAQGRSNGETNKDVWTYNDISATFTDFNWVSDGWQSDEDGITVMRVSSDARITIPYKPFANDFRTSGKTIELEFATRNILDYDASIISCMSGDRGFSVTAQRAMLKSEQSEIGTQYKEDDHVRISFVAEKRSGNRLLIIYINGIASGVVQYPEDDDFAQVTPVNITIGSNDCVTDIYCIRIYDNDLVRSQILDNWIADTQIGSLMADRYNRNNIYDEYGSVVIEKLPSTLPYFILSAPELPQYKGDKKTISGSYTDPINSRNSFTFTGCQINVQGTSSAPYARKNYDLQFKNGFEMVNGTHASNYALTENIVPFNRFVLKADVASSEGANNVELVKLFCDANPFRSIEERADSRVRQGIYGFPIVVFWNNTDLGTTTFLGKYNFNLPKRAPEPYGFSGSMESWEFQNNTSNLMLFKTDYFDETMYTDPDTGDTKELWRYDYEARFPSDEWTDYSQLQELQTFVYSTYRQLATGNTLPSPVTYDEVEYTTDSADYRLAKFKAEFPTYAELDSFIFYYIFTELFLMVDSRAKNLFIGFNGSEVTVPGRVAERKAVAQPYDMDTAIGTNNEGSLVFGYGLEDVDHLTGGANVFNGQDSVLWCNVRDAYRTEIVNMYQRLRSAGIISYDSVEARYEEHQTKWPEAIWLEDAWFKYIDPLINPDPGKQPTAVYLPMMQGSKEEQRKWWLINRFRYMDSKWNAGEALSQVIQLRGYAKANITVTPYADIYPAVKYGSYLVQERGEHGHPTTLVCPLDTVNDTEIYIYSAPQIASVGDLSGLKVGFADFSQATRLQSIKIGDSSNSYENQNLNNLTLGTNRLLKTLDVRNCSALGTGDQKAVDISGCEIIENIYFDGTAITGLTLPTTGTIKVLHLPGTITNLTIRNQGIISEFVMPSYSNITTLRLENNSSEIDAWAILQGLAANSRIRIIGFAWEADDSDEIDDMFDLFDSMRGLDEYGNNVDKAQVAGSIHTDSLTGAQIAAYNERYPYISVTATHVTSYLYYYNYDGTQLLYTETIMDGGDGVYAGQPTRPSTAQYTFTFAGWSKYMNQTTADPNATKNVVADRNVYAAYTAEGQKYTVRFYNGTTLLQTVNNVLYGDSAIYTGETPIYTGAEANDYVFKGWSPSNTNIQGNTDCYAVYSYTGIITRKIINRTITDYANDLVTSVGISALQNANSLKTISFPEATSIGVQAFSNNQQLKTVDIPKATTIQANAFNGCNNLYSINMPKVTNIDISAFSGCRKLQTIDGPEVLTTNTSSFSGCSILESVNLPKLTSIGQSCFNGCTGLTSIVLPSGNTVYNLAFSGCSNLVTADLGQVVSIGSKVFQNCTSLTSVILRHPSTRATLSNADAFSTAPNAIIYVADNLVAGYKTADKWSTYSDRIKGLSELLNA